MQNKPITKFVPSVNVSHFTRRDGSNVHMTALGDFESISSVIVIPSR